MSKVPEDDVEVIKSWDDDYVMTVITGSPFDELLKRFSSWSKLQECISWLSRFMQYKGKPEPAPRPAPRDISLTEMRTSCGLIVKLVQGQYLQDEHEAMASGKQVKANSRLAALCPIPLNGVICVGGRLQCAPMFSDAIHRMVVPNEHPIAKLIIRHYHQALGPVSHSRNGIFNPPW